MNILQEIKELGPDVEDLIMDYKKDLEITEDVKLKYEEVMTEFSKKIAWGIPMLMSVGLQGWSMSIEVNGEGDVRYRLAYERCCDCCGCIMFEMAM